MIYECTDCQHCADFMFGYRVFCLHPDLPPNEVCKYRPVGDKDAERCCDGFDDDDNAKWFYQGSLGKAYAYSEEKYKEVTYQGVREWCLDALAERKGI